MRPQPLCGVAQAPCPPWPVTWLLPLILRPPVPPSPLSFSPAPSVQERSLDYAPNRHQQPLPSASECQGCLSVDASPQPWLAKTGHWDRGVMRWCPRCAQDTNWMPLWETEATASGVRYREPWAPGYAGDAPGYRGPGERRGYRDDWARGGRRDAADDEGYGYSRHSRYRGGPDGRGHRDGRGLRRFNGGDPFADRMAVLSAGAFRYPDASSAPAYETRRGASRGRAGGGGQGPARPHDEPEGPAAVVEPLGERSGQVASSSFCLVPSATPSPWVPIFPSVSPVS